ncbi:site-specific integrase [Microbacterium sp. CFBP 8794]|uniref:site-specific integrase n=1 Tax=Microbacterium sp. CFBP 8794 TaxID=2775269 RepID=UPI001786962D|nr:site-specific integrase [Microbacterium sp. CFBP 8794]MBD8478939.1 site-specific integrase [Microbacterium sp. CFBP 8794]
MSSGRYPDDGMPFAPEIPERWREFADRREALLINYGYNTARAYWADLQDWFEWAVERDKDVLALTEQDKKQYVALLRRRKYSESTIRRRLLVLRLLSGDQGRQRL